MLNRDGTTFQTNPIFSETVRQINGDEIQKLQPTKLLHDMTDLRRKLMGGEAVIRPEENCWNQAVLDTPKTPRMTF